MNQPLTRAETATKTQEIRDERKLLSALAPLLPAVRPNPQDPVTLTGPGLDVMSRPADREALLVSDTMRNSARLLRDRIRVLLDMQKLAREKGESLVDAARVARAAHAEALEHAWVRLLSQNRPLEEAIRGLSLFFQNLETSSQAYRGKIEAVNASVAEMASRPGLSFLSRHLDAYANRPDPREARGFVVAPGWAGTPDALKRLARVTSEYQSVLVTDTPAYTSIEQVEAATDVGGMLSTLPGEQLQDRHTIVVANRGRVRPAFHGKYAAEQSDVYIPLSAPWFGMYMDNIAQGKPWKPPNGYMNPVRGIDKVLLDLNLGEYKAHRYFDRLGLNTALTLTNDGQVVVIWGANTLSTADGGVQVGVAVVETKVARYAEWIVNQYGLFEELDKAEETVKRKLSAFVTLNSGAGRTFKSGSKVVVEIDHANQCLIVSLELLYHLVATKARIRVVKAREKRSEVTVS